MAQFGSLGDRSEAIAHLVDARERLPVPVPASAAAIRFPASAQWSPSMQEAISKAGGETIAGADLIDDRDVAGDGRPQKLAAILDERSPAPIRTTALPAPASRTAATTSSGRDPPTSAHPSSKPHTYQSTPGESRAGPRPPLLRPPTAPGGSWGRRRRSPLGLAPAPPPRARAHVRCCRARA